MMHTHAFRSLRTWLVGYTCDAHRAHPDTPVEECACLPSLPLRIAWRLGLRITEASPPPPEPRWCSHTWPGDPGEEHACELPSGHGAPEHECGCGARHLTDRAADRLLRLIRLPARYGDCLWPEDQPCPRHDLQQPWPPGRDCLGTCTNCSSLADQWHAPSCQHHDPEAEAEYNRAIRAVPTAPTNREIQ